MPDLPDAVHVAEREAVLIPTATPAPFFRLAGEAFAAAAQLDVALLRFGDMTDDVLPITADVIRA